MFFWIIIALFAQFINAGVAVLDKHIVSKTVLRPVSYAFYSGIFQFVYLVLIPFGFVMPEAKYIILALFIGALFVFTLTAFYKAIQISEASRIIPLIGGATSIFTFFLAYLFLSERLVAEQIAAFALFVIGGFLISSKFNNGKTKLIRGLPLAIFTAFLFAAYYVIMKYLYSHTPFLTAFIIIQLGGFLGAGALILSSANRKAVFSASSAAIADKNTIFIFGATKFLGALAAFLIFYAISLGSVTVVNSLEAAKYVFLLILAIIFSKKLPNFFKEQIEDKIIKQKILAIIIISIGLYLLQL